MRLKSLYCRDFKISAKEFDRQVENDEISWVDINSLMELNISTVEHIYDFLFAEEKQFLDNCREELKELKIYLQETQLLIGAGAEGEKNSLEIALKRQKELLNFLGEDIANG